MKRSGFNGIYLISSLLFLLVLIAKPLHQLNHLTDHSHISQNEFTTNESYLNSNDFCEICDFHIPHIFQSINQDFKIKSNSEVFKNPLYSYQNLLSTDFSHRLKKLRAPPIFI